MGSCILQPIPALLCLLESYGTAGLSSPPVSCHHSLVCISGGCWALRHEACLVRRELEPGGQLSSVTADSESFWLPLTTISRLCLPNGLVSRYPMGPSVTVPLKLWRHRRDSWAPVGSCYCSHPGQDWGTGQRRRRKKTSPGCQRCYSSSSSCKPSPFSQRHLSLSLSPAQEGPVARRQ